MKMVLQYSGNCQMKCFKCEKGNGDGYALFRQNEFGVIGVWACRDHNEKEIDKEVDDIVKTIEDSK